MPDQISMASNDIQQGKIADQKHGILCVKISASSSKNKIFLSIGECSCFNSLTDTRQSAILWPIKSLLSTCGSTRNLWFFNILKSKFYSLRGEYLILIGIGALVVQCIILVLGLAQEGVETEAEGVQGNTVD